MLRKILSLAVARFIDPLVLFISRKLVPERYERNAGKTGNMHGEKNEPIPAVIAIIKLNSIK